MCLDALYQKNAQRIVSNLSLVFESRVLTYFLPVLYNCPISYVLMLIQLGCCVLASSSSWLAFLWWVSDLPRFSIRIHSSTKMVTRMAFLICCLLWFYFWLRRFFFSSKLVFFVVLYRVIQKKCCSKMAAFSLTEPECNENLTVKPNRFLSGLMVVV